MATTRHAAASGTASRRVHPGAGAGSGRTSGTGGSCRVVATAASTLAFICSGGRDATAWPSLVAVSCSPSYLVLARLAPHEVVLEPLALGAVDRVERVGAGEGVQVVSQQLHETTPMQSRIRIKPVPDPGLDGAERDAQQSGNLAIAVAAVIRQRHRFALDVGQRVQAAPDPLALEVGLDSVGNLVDSDRCCRRCCLTSDHAGSRLPRT